MMLLFAGLLLSAFGTYRYRCVGQQLDAGRYEPARFAAVAASSAATLLVLIAVVVLV
jgi:putative membrane protein